MTYYKVLGENGKPHHGGMGQWYLPTGKHPGRWMPKIANIKPCQRGYHVVNSSQLVQWLGPCIFIVEVRGEATFQKDKSVHAQARLLRQLTTWNERTARLFAADCAEHVLPLFTKRYPNDNRPALAIQAARDFTENRITANRLAAAWATAGAVSDAAGAAAWNAEYEWQTQRLFHYLEVEP